jgi:hypothetical protein
MFTFVGEVCVDVALASLVCFVGALCSTDWVWPEPEALLTGAACDWEPAWCVALELPAELVAALVLLCSAAWLPPPAALTGVCVEVAVPPAFWSVEADCTTVCDWPPLEEPPVWVWVLLWLVVLSFVDDDVASFELVCELSAAAVPA